MIHLFWLVVKSDWLENICLRIFTKLLEKTIRPVWPATSFFQSGRSNGKSDPTISFYPLNKGFRQSFWLTISGVDTIRGVMFTLLSMMNSFFLSGEMHWPDGRQYTGEFKHGLQHG